MDIDIDRLKNNNNHNKLPCIIYRFFGDEHCVYKQTQIREAKKQKSREAKKQKSREAKKQKSKEAKKQKSKEAEKQKSREAEKQKSRGKQRKAEESKEPGIQKELNSQKKTTGNAGNGLKWVGMGWTRYCLDEGRVEDTRESTRSHRNIH